MREIATYKASSQNPGPILFFSDKEYICIAAESNK